MSALDKVIGYEKAKEELSQILDMLKNSETYKEMGAELPHGVLLYGRPGMGKTLLATSFIEDAGIKTFQVRCTSPHGVLGEIKKAFEDASKEDKAIIFLDDIDKFSESQSLNVDAPAFVAIQSGIDSVKDKDVLVIATANNIGKLPESLKRNGRFDRRLHLTIPNRKDARAIVEYYLRKRKVDPNANYDDIAKMINYSSCADLDKIVNEGAIIAAYKRKPCVQTDDLVEAYLNDRFTLDECTERNFEEKKSTCIHEAGHAVMSEVIKKGSVGLITARTRDGLTKNCVAIRRRPQQVLINLAGKVACELFGNGRVASGCYSDLKDAAGYIRDGIIGSGTNGASLIVPDVSSSQLSDSYKSRVEDATASELERYLVRCREILMKNKDFLLALADELASKGALLYSDVQRIRAEHAIVPCEYTEPDDEEDDSLEREVYERPIPDDDEDDSGFADI